MLMGRFFTLASAKQALKVSRLDTLPSRGNGRSGSYGKSCGLLHGTASAASTIRHVLLGPSVIDANVVARPCSNTCVGGSRSVNGRRFPERSLVSKTAP